MIVAVFACPTAHCQIRCQDGAVVVTKGNVRLLTAPLEGTVKSLYIEAPDDAMLQDLALLRSGPVPEEISPVHRVVLDGMQPARLAWKVTLPRAGRLQKLGDGCVELAAENSAETAFATLSLGRPGLFEVVAQIDDATPGTGIAFLNSKGEPLDGLEFGRESGKRLAFGFGSPQQPPSLDNFDFRNRPAPLAGPRQWLRLVMTAGSIKCWVSGDGVHWGRALEGHDRYGPWQSIGLYARTANDRSNPDNAARHIRLRSLLVRELSGLTGAVAADLLAKAATVGVAMKSDQGESPQAWTERITRSGARGRFAHGLALRLHASGLGRFGAARRGPGLAASRRARVSERSSFDAGQDRSLARCGPRLANSPGPLSSAVGALGTAGPRSA